MILNIFQYVPKLNPAAGLLFDAAAVAWLDCALQPLVAVLRITCNLKKKCGSSLQYIFQI